MLKNMKIGKRLILSYAIILVFLIILGGSSVIMIRRVGNSFTSFYNQQFQTVVKSWEGRRSIYAARSELLQSMINTEKSVREENIEIALSEFNIIKTAMAAVRRTYNGNPADIDAIDKLLAQGEGYLDSMTELARENKTEQAYEIFNETYRPIMDQVRKKMADVASVAADSAAESVEMGRRLTVTATVLTIIIILVSVASGIALSVIMTAGIRRPLEEIESAAGEMAKGNLNVDIKYEGHDELGSLAASMRNLVHMLAEIVKEEDYLLGEMGRGNFKVGPQNETIYVGDFHSILLSMQNINKNLSDALRQINQSSDQVASGSEQVSSGAQALS